MGTDTVDTERPEGESAGTQTDEHPAEHAEQTVEQQEADDLAERRGEEFAVEHADTREWLEEQFPEWAIEVAATSTWSEGLRPIWIAHKDGHHPQSELTAGKLHTRLSEYIERREHHRARMN